MEYSITASSSVHANPNNPWNRRSCITYRAIIQCSR